MSDKIRDVWNGLYGNPMARSDDADEIIRLRAEVKRLQEALTPLLSKEARNRLTEYAEAARGMDRNKMATTLEIVLESDAKRRAALTAQEKRNEE